MRFIRTVHSAFRILTTAGAVGALVAVAGVTPALAVTSQPRPTPSFNGAVFAVAYRGDTVYVGGSFSGVSAGGRFVARQRLAAFNARTGALLGWHPAASGTVKALAVSGNAVFAAGDFSTVSGARRDGLARLDATTGAVGSFSHSLSGEAAVLAVGSGRLYVGGHFGRVDGAPRGNVAAFSLASGALDGGWKPNADNRVDALATYGARVYLGGSFHKISGVTGAVRIASVNASSGAVVRSFLPKAPADVFGLAVDPRGVYAATGGAGGRAVAYTVAGKVRWAHLFNGDLHGITTLGGVTYVGGHFDTACRNVSTISQLGCVGGAVSRVKLAALDSGGRLTGWDPKANGIVGVRAMAAIGGQIAAVGEFTTIGGSNRQRYASFG
jgi:hypothetical protein